MLGMLAGSQAILLHVQSPVQYPIRGGLQMRATEILLSGSEDVGAPRRSLARNPKWIIIPGLYSIQCLLEIWEAPFYFRR